MPDFVLTNWDFREWADRRCRWHRGSTCAQGLLSNTASRFKYGALFNRKPAGCGPLGTITEKSTRRPTKRTKQQDDIRNSRHFCLQLGRKLISPVSANAMQKWFFSPNLFFCAKVGKKDLEAGIHSARVLNPRYRGIVGLRA